MNVVKSDSQNKRRNYVHFTEKRRKSKKRTV